MAPHATGLMKKRKTKYIEDMELDLEPLRLPSDNERPFVIAGPCSAETEEQVMKTAFQLASKGCHNFRAGIWKPRTKPGGFEGHGEKALPWLKRVKDETGMLITTEVATPEHVELALKYGLDMLWIGARTTANPFAMQAIADSLKGVDIPVLVKNPVNPDLELWIGALERLNNAGIKRLGAIHRGSPVMTSRCTVTCRCGRYLSSCADGSHSCPSSATPVISVVGVTSLHRSVNRRWT